MHNLIEILLCSSKSSLQYYQALRNNVNHNNFLKVNGRIKSNTKNLKDKTLPKRYQKRRDWSFQLSTMVRSTQGHILTQ